VTGGAGFIGSALCRELLIRGHDVTCVDNYYSGSQDNIKELFKNKCFHFDYLNIIDGINGHFDQIYNLACPASPTMYQCNPVFTLKTCFTGSVNVLELAKNSGARILQASTSEVYGEPNIHPQEESYTGNVNPNTLRSCYAEGKRVAETLFFNYRMAHEVNTVIVRIFNTYGSRMRPDDGRVISNFIVKSLKGEPLEIYGDGSQTRSFCYIDDVVKGLILCMDAEHKFAGPFNIGNPSELSIRELAELILFMTKSDSKIIYKQFIKDDPRRRKPNISMITKELGWYPEIGLEDGLAKMIQYFRQTRKLQ